MLVASDNPHGYAIATFLSTILCDTGPAVVYIQAPAAWVAKTRYYYNDEWHSLYLELVYNTWRAEGIRVGMFAGDI